MEWALEKGHFDASASIAVQSAVSAADAFTVFHLGLRSRGRDHTEVARLISKCRSPAASDVRRQVEWLLSMKTQVQYEDMPVRSADANSIVQHARRLLSLAVSDVGGSNPR